MPIKRVWLSFAVTIFVSVGFIDMAAAKTSLENELRQEHQMLADYGYTRWEWLKTDCHDCDMVMLAVHPDLRNEKVRDFITALAAHKYELQYIYKIDGEEYNLLAHMAVGILGRESEFFTSSRYKIKEAAPLAVSLLKVLRIYMSDSDAKVSANSRGPTQIKVIPQSISDRYNIEPEDLGKPENAAVATMGFLIEALGELKNRIRVNKLDHINKTNYVDYLPYIYFGSTRALVNKTATPEKNLYVQNMKKYMTWVEVYQKSTSMRPD
ncbi:hypothetical protein D3C87_242110 [compost metagenome]